MEKANHWTINKMIHVTCLFNYMLSKTIDMSSWQHVVMSTYIVITWYFVIIYDNIHMCIYLNFLQVILHFWRMVGCFWLLPDCLITDILYTSTETGLASLFKWLQIRIHFVSVSIWNSHWNLFIRNCSFKKTLQNLEL